MIRNELKNDFHAFLKISVSPTLGPSSRGSRLRMVLEMVHMSSLFIYETHVIDWLNLQPIPGLKSTVSKWFHMEPIVSLRIIYPAEKFHKSQNIFQGEKNEMSLKGSETN